MFRENSSISSQNSGSRVRETGSPGRLALLLCLLIVTIFGLNGCGYSMGGSQETVMGDASKTLMVKGVEHPTMFPWLGYVVRSELRDELGARNVATWVDSAPADYSILIKIDRFTMRSSIHDDNDVTLVFDGNMTLEAFVYRDSDNVEVWRSGIIEYFNTFETNVPEEAGEMLTKQCIRRLVSKMRNTF